MSNRPKKRMAKDQIQAIQSMQEDPNMIIGRNSLANLKFGIRQQNGTVKNAKATTHIAKVFWEAISQLIPTDLEGINPKNGYITKQIDIGNMVKTIGTEGHYKYVIDAARMLRVREVQLVDDEGNTSYTGFFTHVKHIEKTGILEVQMSAEWVKYVLDVVQKGNFSFEKNFVLVLQNVSAIRFYPFFKSWVNKGRYDTDLERFKKDFGYDTSGYNKFSNLRDRVLEPAMREINEKTDINVKYDLIGENLEGTRPRISGLRFFITAKEKQKQEAKQLEGLRATETTTGDPQHINQLIQAKQENSSHKANISPINEPKLIQADLPNQTQQSPQQANISTTEPSFEDIRKLISKDVFTDDEIDEFIKEFGYTETWERIKGFKKANTENQIKVPFAYVLRAKGLGIGLWKREQQKQQEYRAKQEAEQIKKLNEEYEKRKVQYFEKVFEEATQAEQNQVIEAICEQEPQMKNYYIKGDQFTILGKRKVGRILVDEIYTDEQISKKGLFRKAQRQHNFRNTVFGRDSIQIGFDENDRVIKNSLFQEPQEPTAQAEIIEQIQEPTQPKAKTQAKPRAKKPQAIKEPTVIKLKQEIEKSIESQEQPKSFWKKLFGK